MFINTDFIYPVGAIYMSVNSTNPSVLFGGTWVSWGVGRTPVGVDTSQTEFNTVEKTGGEKTHTLTVDEMPSHMHPIDFWNNWDGSGSIDFGAGGGALARINRGTNWGNYAGNNGMHETGGSRAHNNMPPYITCYMWKRTA